MRIKFYILLTLASLTIMIAACKKTAGPGGFAQISGKVRVLDYTTNPDTLFNLGYVYQDQYYIIGKTVYLRYGDEPGIGQIARTSFNGTYTFDDLRPGKYKVIVYSRSIDTITDKNLQGSVAVIKEVEVIKKKEQLTVEEIVIIE